LRSIHDRLQEQLSKAYSECISIGTSQFSIKGQYTSKISLTNVLESIPDTDLASNLASMRKEIFSKYIDQIINGSTSLHCTSPSILEVRTSTGSNILATLEELFKFIHDQLLPYIPENVRSSFAKSFYNKLSDTIQANFLIPLIPSNTEGLPAYLGSMREAIQFEKDIAALGFFSGAENRIQNWAENAQSHYERQRRTQLLDSTRRAILQDAEGPLRIEVEVLQEEMDSDVPNSPNNHHTEEEEPSNWHFDDAEGGTSAATTQPHTSSNHPKEEDPEGDSGWGFDDDEPAADDQPVENDDPWGVEWDDPPSKDSAPTSTSNQAQVHETLRKSSLKPKIPPSRKPNESFLVSHAAKVVASQADDVFEEILALISSKYVYLLS
jgi:protein transport protein DSL1/ZW10